VAVVQYTFTHKQYTEQHNETIHRTYIIIRIRKHNNKIKQKRTKHTTIYYQGSVQAVQPIGGAEV